MRVKNPKHTWYSILLALVILAATIYLEFNRSKYGMAVSVIQKSLIFAVVAVAMNLLNGFTGLFSLGQAGFMAIGAYATAMLTIPVERMEAVYYMSGVVPWLMSLKRALSVLPEPVLIIIAMLIGGMIAGLFAFLIGIPVLRLKSDYLAIATLGFAEIVRGIISAPQLDQFTNGSYGLKNIPGFGSNSLSFMPDGFGVLLVPLFASTILIGFIVLVINSSYGRAFKAIREDEIAAEAMGINLLKHKQMSFVLSSFVTAIAGGMLAMFMRSIEPRAFSTIITYDILLIVVIGGLGSITGSVLGAFVVTFAKDWFLRFFDVPLIIGGFQVPFLRIGFRMVIFSILLMVVVLFYRRGLMGNSEFTWHGFFNLFRRRLKRPEVMAETSGGSMSPIIIAPGRDQAPAPLIPDPPGGEPEEEADEEAADE
ncbi:MAG: branched-chain amino acid ABC transporter permease [Tissierellia bacterium]|nr:branched-chain amino acid ABC transporter permease [Tissierellia bacterium]